MPLLQAMDITVLLSVLLAGFTARQVYLLVTPVLDPREPPLIRPKIPVIGHLLAFFFWPHQYLFDLNEKKSYAIGTLPMLRGKVYVINDPHLVQAAFRNSKAISFVPLVNEYIAKIQEMSTSARENYTQDGMHERMMQLFTSKMAGSSLHQMNKVAIKEIYQVVTDQGIVAGMEIENLWDWVRDMMTMITTTTLFGRDRNPFRNNPHLIKYYWDWEAGDTSRRATLAATIAGIKDRQHHEGYTALYSTLTRYFEDNCFEDDVSQLTVETAKMQREYGFSAGDMGVAYVQVIHAALMNVVPTIFWVLVNVFSRPILLAELRTESRNAIEERITPDGSQQAAIKVGQLETLCPKLYSVLRETLRLTSVSTLYRRVLQDTSVSEQDSDRSGKAKTYLLKKGVTIMISKIVGSRNPELWASETEHNPNQFDPARFIDWSTKQKTHDEVSSSRRKAYYPFGGGKELCPGRNFAATEVLGLMVVLLNAFELTSASDDGTLITLPKPAKPKMTTGVVHPAQNQNLRAIVKRRQGWENVEWFDWNLESV